MVWSTDYAGNMTGGLSMDFGPYRENLQILMDARGYTKTDLARELNLPLATISRHLSGDRNPDLAYVVKVADFFGVSLDWLLGRSDERFETLAPEVAEFTKLYSLASDADRAVINTLLSRYKVI